MSDSRSAAPADPRTHNGNDSADKHLQDNNNSYINTSSYPHSLRDVLKSTNGGSLSTPSDSTTSEEDYDTESKKSVAVLLPRRTHDANPLSRAGSNLKVVTMSSDPETPSDVSVDVGSLDDMTVLKGTKIYTIASDDKELRAILKRGMQRVRQASDMTSTHGRLTDFLQAKESGTPSKHKGRFRDYVFTRKFSTFDMRNEVAATSPFHGFFTLFWIAVTLFMLKIGTENWRNTGSVLGTNDIMQGMFKRDVVVLLTSDGVMCALTGVSWILQVLVHKGYLDWDGSGWILQNIWQTIFIGGNIGWTQLRSWPWEHTVFFVLHTLIMLMKQHSYAFYNGYLSTAYKKRDELRKKLKQLEQIEATKPSSPGQPTASAVSREYLARRPSTSEIRQRRRSLHSGSETFSKDLEEIEASIDSDGPLDLEQIQLFEKIIKWEIDALTEELHGKATSPERGYPNNLTFTNHYEYIPIPTLVYELEYPRSDSINWRYVAEKLAATFGVIFVMIMVSQAFIYPVVMKTVAMKEAGMSLTERFREFPWLLSDLIFPFMLEYIMSWYVIWEVILNLLGEVTYFADREFYSDWWNSVSWDQFARDWNRPVHNFLLRHVYHSSISAMQVNKHTATIITFFLSACVHELVMWCIFKKLRGYLLVLQMCQLPVSVKYPSLSRYSHTIQLSRMFWLTLEQLVRLSRTKWLKGKQTLGNVIFWLGIFTGPSILCSLYLIL